MLIRIKDIATNITNEAIGKIIYDKIHKNLENEKIILDFTGVNVITTYCAKQIFKTIMNEIGEDEFNKKIAFENITSTIEYEINMGLND